MSSLPCHAACAYASPRLKRRLHCECDMYVLVTVLLRKKDMISQFAGLNALFLWS